MFGRDRFNLSRFSLGSQNATIPIEATFIEELKQVAGMAVPVPTTAFFNDVIRGTLRGAITKKSTFESSAEMRASCFMKANIVLVFASNESVNGAVYGSKKTPVNTVFYDNLERYVHGSKTFPCFAYFDDAIVADVYGVKDIKSSLVVNEVMMSLFNAIKQSTETVRIDITLPPGAEIRIDSETYRVLMNGNNILYAQTGDWLTLSRELLNIDVESASGGSLTGTIIYTERYL